MSFVRSSLAMAALGLLPGCGDDEPPATPPPSGPSVLLITVDTLRADVLGCYGGDPTLCPRIDELAAQGRRFARAFTSTPLTLPAHSTMLSGLNPPRHGVRDNALYRLPEELPTLAEQASAAGWDTAAFVAAFVLDARYGLAQGFDHYDDDIERPGEGHAGTVHERGCEEVSARALAWLEDRGDRPFLAWVHFYDPHFPYEAHPQLPPREGATGRHAAYEGECAWVDRHVGALLDGLAAQGRLDDTLVVFSSDHGEALGEHGEPTHGHFVYQSTMDIPLILRHPELPAGVDHHAAGLVDVAPTVLSFLGLEVPATMQGRDLLATGEPADAAPMQYMESELARISFGFQPLAAASDGRHKYIDAPRAELYDLRTDPGEQRNLLLEQTDHPAVAPLRRFVRERRAEEALDARFRGTDSDRERVENLGYSVGQAEAPVSREDWTMPELLDVIALRDLARGQLTAGRSRECLESCQRLVELAPRCSQGWEVGGTALARLDRWEEAKTWLRTALEIHEALPEAHWNLATAHYRTGNEEEAWFEVERTYQLDPEHQGALALLAPRLEAEDAELALQMYRTLARVAGDGPQGTAARRRAEQLAAKLGEEEDG